MRDCLIIPGASTINGAASKNLAASDFCGNGGLQTKSTSVKSAAKPDATLCSKFADYRVPASSLQSVAILYVCQGCCAPSLACPVLLCLL